MQKNVTCGVKWVTLIFREQLTPQVIKLTSNQLNMNCSTQFNPKKHLKNVININFIHKSVTRKIQEQNVHVSQKIDFFFLGHSS